MARRARASGSRASAISLPIRNPAVGFRGIDNLPGTLSQVSTDDPVILMVHEPDIFTQVPDRVSLTLAGHTHGGQLRLPLVWPALVPSEYGARFAYGHVREGGRDLIVSGGLGTSIVPLRLGVPPEILRIELGDPECENGARLGAVSDDLQTEISRVWSDPADRTRPAG